MTKERSKWVYRGFEIMEVEGAFLVNGGLEHGWKGHESLGQAIDEIDDWISQAELAQQQQQQQKEESESSRW